MTVSMMDWLNPTHGKSCINEDHLILLGYETGWRFLYISLLFKSWCPKMIQCLGLVIFQVIKTYQFTASFGYFASRGAVQILYTLLILYAIEKMKRETSKTIKELSVKDKVYQKVLDSIPELILIINSEATITHTNSHFKNFIGKSDVTSSNDLTQFSKLKIENTRLDETFTHLALRTKFKKLNHDIQTLSPIRAQTRDSLLCNEADVKEYNDLELALHKSTKLSQIVKSILQNILFFEANKSFHLIYDCKSIHPETQLVRSIEIKFSISESRNKRESVVVAVFRDTTERDVIVTLENDSQFKNDMLATISHELRTPLNGNINFIEAALASKDISESTKAEFLEPALNCSYLLKWVINDILDLALINAKTIKPNVSCENLQNTVETCVKLVAKKIQHKGLKLVTHLPQIPILFSTDHSRLFQILLNLLNNAIKFSETGTITVSVTTHSNSVTLAVSDEGIGMTSECQVQLQSYLKENTMQKKLNEDSAGSGLGLFISNCHAKMLGFSCEPTNGIQFNSTKTKGSNFWFTIEEKSKKIIRHSSHIDSPKGGYHFKSCDVRDNLETLVNTLTPDHIKLTPQESRSTSDGGDIDEGVVQNSLLNHSTRPMRRFSVEQISPPYVSFPCICPKILIVDDDPFNILSLQKMLASLGHECNTAYHGKEAIQKFNQRRLQSCGKKCVTYQLILMDCNMPIMNGFDASKAIKTMLKLEEKQQPKIIGCTAYVTENASAEGSACGMDMLLSKPLSRATLKDLITVC
jgi:signal transduction histidine kinase